VCIERSLCARFLTYPTDEINRDTTPRSKMLTRMAIENRDGVGRGMCASRRTSGHSPRSDAISTLLGPEKESHTRILSGVLNGNSRLDESADDFLRL
jgi:hypothetical protein